MKLRSPWLIRLIALLASWLIRIWTATVRKHIVFLDGFPHPTDHRTERYIYAFWHEDILLAAVQRARIHMLSSLHADGELIARVAHHLGRNTVRGSTTRGGAQALLDLVRISQRSHLGITPDGPKGPRRRVQMGLIFLAAQTGLPIVSLGIGYTRAWRARSWDRFAVPMPGSLAVGVVAAAVHVPRGLNRKQMESYRQLVEERMNAASDAAERWAAEGIKPRCAPVRRAA
jgi:lysophospholipid acyltransferase (LPLAT)-like uncharacterized protein